MQSLRDLYWGAQDKYFSNPEIKPITLESEYVTTLKESCMWESEAPKKGARFTFTLDRKEGEGYLGLRFVGTPSSVKQIEFELGGQRMDRIYPSMTGQFDSFSIFEVGIPYLAYHECRLNVEFCKEDVPLDIYYDKVRFLKELPKVYESFFSTTQYTGEEEVPAGSGSFKLNYNHPVERIRFFTTAPLTKQKVVIHDSDSSLHVPYKGMQGDKHLYEVLFHGSLNFSRMDKASFVFEAAEPTTIYALAKNWQVCRFMSGMAGLAFSK